MPQEPASFRDFGILPANVQPPVGTVRADYSTARVVGQYVGTLFVSSFGIGLAIIFLLILPMPISLLGIAASLCAAGTVVFLATRRDYRWVELEGDVIRAKHLYTGRVLQRNVADISSLGTMVYQVRPVQVAMMENLLGRVRGIEIRFKNDATLLRVMRADPAMTNAGELIEAIVYRMSQRRELDADIIDFRGSPLVRSIHWKGDARPVARSNGGTIIAVCLMILALLFGAIQGFIGAQRRTLNLVGSVPPKVMSVASLIESGPGENRHLTLIDFQPGGYAVESNNERWTSVWIALYPANQPIGQYDAIRVVLSTNAVRDKASLLSLVNSRRINCICSAAQQTGWGATLGPELVTANNGRPLQAAWTVEVLNEVPTADEVKSIFTTFSTFMGAALFLAIGVIGYQLIRRRVTPSN